MTPLGFTTRQITNAYRVHEPTSGLGLVCFGFNEWHKVRCFSCDFTYTALYHPVRNISASAWASALSDFTRQLLRKATYRGVNYFGVPCSCGCGVSRSATAFNFCIWTQIRLM